jgi:hypothetical protein
LTLVRDRQTMLRRQLTKLLMGETHDYWIRIIINEEKRCQPKSVAIFLS